jgi:serine/threonine-protein kinase
VAIEAGQQLLHYRLIEKIGEGGMGVVWKAVDSTLDREVAIKILPDGFAADPERLSRFEREAKLLASLNHPNIAGIYGIHKASDSGPFLAMELVEGEDLAERLNRGALPTDEALRIALEISRAFEAAHESGVIHRDLKPANVRLTPEGQVKVLDFGLAKALSPEASGPGGNPSISPTLTSTGTVAGMILGTAAYMSPEQAKGKRVDRRADIWSFGVVLFELLSGRMLFAGETISETLAAVILKEIDLEGLPADVSPAIRVLLERCLRRDPTARLRDIGDARIAIEEVLDGRVPELAPRGDAAPFVAGSRKGERLVWLTVVALSIAIGLWSWLTPGETNRSDEDWRLSIARPRDASGEFIAISPDGSTLAYSGDAGVLLRPLDQLDPVPIKGTEYGLWPFWSPDNRYLGFIQDRKLKRVAVATGQIDFIAEMPNPRAPGSWFADGQILFQAWYETALLSVPADGSSPPAPVTIQDDRLDGVAGHRWAAPLPDGKRFVFVEHDYSAPTSAIRVGSFDSPDSRVILPARPVRIRFLSVCDGYLLYNSDDALLAHPFDAERAEFTGDPRRLLDGARVASAVVSKNGVLAWVPAYDSENDPSLAWFDRERPFPGMVRSKRQVVGGDSGSSSEAGVPSAVA